MRSMMDRQRTRGKTKIVFFICFKMLFHLFSTALTPKKFFESTLLTLSFSIGAVLQVDKLELQSFCLVNINVGKGNNVFFASQ